MYKQHIPLDSSEVTVPDRVAWLFETALGADFDKCELANEQAGDSYSSTFKQILKQTKKCGRGGRQGEEAGSPKSPTRTKEFAHSAKHHARRLKCNLCGNLI